MQNRISLLTSENKKSTTFSTATVTLVPLHQAIFRPQIFYLVKIPLAAKSHSRPIRSTHLPSFIWPHVEIFHVQNIVLEAII